MSVNVKSISRKAWKEQWQTKKFETFKPYPEELLSDIVSAFPKTPDRYYTICMVLRELYQDIPNPEIRLKLRYIGTLAKAITDHVHELDPIWFHEMYPTVGEFEQIMQIKKEAVSE